MELDSYEEKVNELTKTAHVTSFVEMLLQFKLPRLGEKLNFTLKVPFKFTNVHKTKTRLNMPSILSQSDGVEAGVYWENDFWK